MKRYTMLIEGDLNDYVDNQLKNKKDTIASKAYDLVTTGTTNAKKAVKKRILRMKKKSPEQFKQLYKSVKDSTLGARVKRIHDGLKRFANDIKKDSETKAKEAKNIVGKFKNDSSLKSKAKKTLSSIQDKGKKAVKQFKKLPNGQKVAVAAIPAAVVAGGAAAIYAWWKKNHKSKK